MCNPRVKVEMSTIICNELMKGNTKCKNYRFEPPFGGLRGNAQGSSAWLDGKRFVDFLLPIIAILASSHVWSLLSEIFQNRRFLTGVGDFERKF